MIGNSTHHNKPHFFLVLHAFPAQLNQRILGPVVDSIRTDILDLRPRELAASAVPRRRGLVPSVRTIHPVARGQFGATILPLSQCALRCEMRTPNAVLPNTDTSADPAKLTTD